MTLYRIYIMARQLQKLGGWESETNILLCDGYLAMKSKANV